MSRSSTQQERRVKIRLFGSFGIWIDGNRVFGLHRREGEKLLAYLVLHAGEPVTYRTLATLFWPSEAYAGMDGGATFQSTRQAVRALRVALGAEASRLVSVGKGIFWLDIAGADVDVTRFDYCVQNSADSTLRAEAIELHSAPLLEDWNDAWVAEARQRRVRSLNRVTGIQQSADTEVGLLLPEQSSTTGTEAYILDSSGTGGYSRPKSSPPTFVGGRGGGAVSPYSRSYTSRICDAQFADAIQSGDGTILIKGGIQSGKSSLLAKGLQQARSIGSRVCLTDFSMLSEGELASTDALFMALAASIAIQMDLEFDPGNTWVPHLGPGMNLEQFLRRQALRKAEGRLVWAMDDVDRLFRQTYADEFFGLLRSWHNRRALDPTGPWQHLTLTLAYSTEASLFIRDVNQSPFNIGTQIHVEPFNLEELHDLNCRFGEPLKCPSDIRMLREITGGNPYLVRCGLEAISQGVGTLDSLQKLGFDYDQPAQRNPFERHLRRLYADIRMDQDLKSAIRNILAGKQADRDSFARLLSAGIVCEEWQKPHRFACKIYHTYFLYLNENCMLDDITME